jgi:hypothetical protein
MPNIDHRQGAGKVRDVVKIMRDDATTQPERQARATRVMANNLERSVAAPGSRDELEGLRRQIHRLSVECRSWRIRFREAQAALIEAGITLPLPAEEPDE